MWGGGKSRRKGGYEGTLGEIFPSIKSFGFNFIYCAGVSPLAHTRAGVPPVRSAVCFERKRSRVLCLEFRWTPLKAAYSLPQEMNDGFSPIAQCRHSWINSCKGSHVGHIRFHCIIDPCLIAVKLVRMERSIYHYLFSFFAFLVHVLTDFLQKGHWSGFEASFWK